MKITDVEAIALNMPLSQASKAGTYKIVRRGTILTTISTGDGTTGQTYIGQTRTEIPEQLEACRFINGVLKGELLGEDPLMIERLWTKMHRHIEDYSPYDRSNRTIALESVACVDSALYDLAGKALGVPVYKLLGGSRDDVPLVQVQYYRQSDDFSEQLEGLRKAALDAKRAGFIGVKLKVGARARARVGVGVCRSSPGWSRKHRLRGVFSFRWCACGEGVGHRDWWMFDGFTCLGSREYVEYEFRDNPARAPQGFAHLEQCFFRGGGYAHQKTYRI